MFTLHGTQKWLEFPVARPNPTVLWSESGIAGVLELVGGILLMLGFFTRPVAFVLSGLMAFADFLAHAPAGFWPIVNKRRARGALLLRLPLHCRGRRPDRGASIIGCGTSERLTVAAMSANPKPVTIAVDDAQNVSGLLQTPAGGACYVVAHGAGAGMTHPFMASVAERSRRSAASRRFAICSRTWSAARGSRHAAKLAQATVRAAVTEAARLVPSCPCSRAASPSAGA